MNIALIARKQKVARATARQMGEYVEAFAPGSSIAGRRFDLVICYGWRPGDGNSEIERKSGEEWFRSSIQTAVMRGGNRIIYVPEILAPEALLTIT